MTVPKPVLEYFAAFGLDEAKVRGLYAPSRSCGCGAAPPPAKPEAGVSPPTAPGREPPCGSETVPEAAASPAGPKGEGFPGGFWTEDSLYAEEEPKDNIWGSGPAL